MSRVYIFLGMAIQAMITAAALALGYQYSYLSMGMITVVYVLLALINYVVITWPAKKRES